MNKKEEVIKAARELFELYGFKKVSMDEIAKKSNVTKRTIYTYFKDKNDLIKYFLYEELGNMKDMVSEIENENMDFAKKIHKLISTLLEYRKSSKILQKFSMESKNLSLGIANEGYDIVNKTIINEVKTLLEKAIKEGHVKKCNTDLSSFIIYKIYVALMFEWDKPIDKNEVTESIMKILTNGLFYQGGEKWIRKRKL